MTTSRRVALVVAVVALLAAGTVLSLRGSVTAPPTGTPVQPVSGTLTRPAIQPLGSAAAAATDAPVADPVEIRIPRIGVASPLVRLGVDGAGVLQPPSTADVAGWFAGGVRPGEPGPAVIAGHVDSRAGPGVFFDLRRLVPGDRVEIVDAAGHIRAFSVRSVEQTGKNAFPTESVYGPTPVSEIRMITCGGEFLPQSGSYHDNVIVNATFV